MHIPVRRFDTELPLPEYKTVDAVAADCVARIDVTIEPQHIGYVPLNIALKPPPGHVVLLAARSSLHKRGLMLANGVGLMDEDYCGDDDEYQAVMFNFTQAPVEIKRGERVAQIALIPYEKITWEEKDSLGSAMRGGFGTTGH